MRIERTRRFTYLAMLSAMAITLNLLETAILPPVFGFFRVGLANIIALVTIRILGVKDMIIVNVMRVVIGSLLSGTFLGSIPADGGFGGGDIYAVCKHRCSNDCSSWSDSFERQYVNYTFVSISNHE